MHSPFFWVSIVGGIAFISLFVAPIVSDRVCPVRRPRVVASGLTNFRVDDR